MAHNSRRTAAFTFALAAGALAVGCAAGGDPTPEPAPDARSEEQPENSAQEPTTEENSTDCLTGKWSLDVADYAAQSYEWLVSLPIPLDHLNMSGSQTLTISDDVFNIGSDLHTDASVYGVPISTVGQWAGSGEWWWDGEGSPTITITDWAYTVDPTPVAPDAPAVPPLFDPAGSEPILAVCNGDSLSLKGADAPLAGNFTRVE